MVDRVCSLVAADPSPRGGKWPSGMSEVSPAAACVCDAQVISARLYPIYSSYPDHKLGYAPWREGGMMAWVLLMTVYVAFTSRGDAASSRQSLKIKGNKMQHGAT